MILKGVDIGDNGAFFPDKHLKITSEKWDLNLFCFLGASFWSVMVSEIYMIAKVNQIFNKSDIYSYTTCLVCKQVDQLGSICTRCRSRYHPASRTREGIVASSRHRRCLWVLDRCSHHTCTSLSHPLYEIANRTRHIGGTCFEELPA